MLTASLADPMPSRVRGDVFGGGGGGGGQSGCIRSWKVAGFGVKKEKKISRAEDIPSQSGQPDEQRIRQRA